MDCVRVVKTSDNLNYGIYFADIVEKLVSKPFAFAGPLYKPCDIYKLNCCRNNLLGFAKLSSLSSGTFTTPTFGSIVQNG